MNSLTIKSVKANRNRLIIAFKCRGQISKFFQTNQFYADYNTAIEAVPEEILVIPFLAAVLPIVWANHAVIYVHAVDETFIESMKTYKKSLQKMYPKLSLGGRLITKHTTKQHLSFQSKKMMLFSGGVDSLVTFIRHRNEHLILVCVHGADIEPDNNIEWAGAITPITKFARNNKSPLKTVRSNFKAMIDFLIIRAYDDYINENNGWWGRVMHGLALVGLCAPLAYVERTGKLYIASSYTSDFSGGWGSHPSLDNTIKWTGTVVVHDGYELSRQEKILVISNYVENCASRVIIRSCWYSDIGENCGHCEKCSRTILGLELAGINPDKYGFNIKPDTFLNIKRNLLNGGWPFGDDQIFMWEDLKRHAYLKDNIIHSEAKSLIDWLENVDVSSFPRARVLWATLFERKHDYGKKLNPFFMCLPDPVYRIAKKCYYVAASLFPSLFE